MTKHTHLLPCAAIHPDDQIIAVTVITQAAAINAIEVQPVGTATGVVHRIGARPGAVEIRVVAHAADEHVIAILAYQLVIAGATDQDVLAGSAEAAVATGQVIIAIATFQLVIAPMPNNLSSPARPLIRSRLLVPTNCSAFAVPLILDG